jgi:predicted nucleic acid-binding Zn ribbon protein
MWHKKAVCVRCGALKREALTRCSCGFLPFSDYERARALILSELFSVGSLAIGRAPTDLQRISAEIRSGRPYLFDAAEEQTAVDAARELDTAAQKRHKKNRLLLSIVGIVLVLMLGFLLWQRLTQSLLQTGVE